MSKDEVEKFGAEALRDFMLFFGVLFFTCVVGIIEFLPELEKTNGVLSGSWLIVSIIYFGLVFVINYSVEKCFFIYWEIKTYTGRWGCRYPEIENAIEKIFRKPMVLKWFLICAITIIFILLYLVKIGIIL